MNVTLNTWMLLTAEEKATLEMTYDGPITEGAALGVINRRSRRHPMVRDIALELADCTAALHLCRSEARRLVKILRHRNSIWAREQLTTARSNTHRLMKMVRGLHAEIDFLNRRAA